MKLIPVVDLLGGQVVRGVRGDRKNYKPIGSALVGSSDPVTVARVLTDHCASDCLYIADLDALQGGTTQVDVIAEILDALPGIALWLDAGFADVDAASAALRALGGTRRIAPVFGSESLASRAALARLQEHPDALLSLDRRDGVRLDAAGCWDAPELWPARVIVMTLERVGSDAGPDLDTLQAVRRCAPRARIVGAGGIRSPQDLMQAAETGADAWLVASALHDLRLPRTAR